MTAIELPGRAVKLFFTALFFPARCNIFINSTLIAQEKEYLTFDIGWNISPALFVGMNSFYRNTKNFSKLFLGFAKSLPVLL